MAKDSGSVKETGKLLQTVRAAALNNALHAVTDLLAEELRTTSHYVDEHGEISVNAAC